MTQLVSPDTSAARRHSQSTEVIFAGIDTHKDTHTAAVIDGLGRVLEHRQFPATQTGYQQLTDWAAGHGRIAAAGVEGTNSYGAGLARHLRHAGICVREVHRPNRSGRRNQGKSDPIDAIAAARAAATGEGTATPKTSDGRVQALRALTLLRDALVQDRSDHQKRLQDLLITAPAALRETLRKLSPARLVTACTTLTADPAQVTAGDHEQATRRVLATLAAQHRALSAEITTLDKQITAVTTALNPGLMALGGVGPHTAAILLLTAGDNPQRLRNREAFAMLCGAAPIPASSGKKTRYRLSRGGDRQANHALWRIAMTRLATDQTTRDYRDRRLADGKTTKDVLRLLKTYIAREIFKHLVPTTPENTPEPVDKP